ncbi:hypothetical protein B0H15DRAFT_578616 [Mycena belliarum]|uniref:Uncharacterized protein n=1 Tax=Mycena belliarum TaxID=1033014 RepID=A0AAD6XK42_9AGAR|nr:hypothetical protein B0H15DRAFT_578616 [Mycena belliae]
MPQDVGHVLSIKSADLQRDTFIFVRTSQGAKLFMGVNQKFTPVSSATIHRWVDFMRVQTSAPPEGFFLCPVTVCTSGIMSYGVDPCGAVIEPDSTEILAPGNYGWCYNREGIVGGPPRMTMYVRERRYTLEARMTAACEESDGLFIPDVLSPAAKSEVLTRDGHRCRFTGAECDNVAWIIPPGAAFDTQNFFTEPHRWDKSPFLVAANAITMQSQLRFHFHNNHFAVDVDDDYRILVLRAMGDAQELLPTHLPSCAQQDASVDHFFRLHCRHTLNLMLLGGDIKEVYPNSVIMAAMEELGVAYHGSDNENPDMAPLDDERWHTEIGQAILTQVLKNRIDRSLDESERADEQEESSPPSDSDDSPEEEVWEESPASVESSSNTATNPTIHFDWSTYAPEYPVVKITNPVSFGWDQMTPGPVPTSSFFNEFMS